MSRFVLASLGLLTCAGALHAEDARLVERPYDPNTVVRIEGRSTVQATIRFGAEEMIENVAIGDSNAWQVTPNKRANLLFVKPLAEKAVTNMTVVTNAHTYFFDLVATPKAANPLYELAFTYPQDDKAVAPHKINTDAGAVPTDVELAAAADPAAIADPADLNFAWGGTGDKKLLPSRIFDDGQATYLSWPAGTPVPAILIKDKTGTEGPVNFAVRGDVIVVDGVPSEIILRSGRQVATIENRGSERKSAALAQLEKVTK